MKIFLILYLKNQISLKMSGIVKKELIVSLSYIYKKELIVSLSLRPLFASTCKYRSYII